MLRFFSKRRLAYKNSFSTDTSESNIRTSKESRAWNKPTLSGSIDEVGGRPPLPIDMLHESLYGIEATENPVRQLFGCNTDECSTDRAWVRYWDPNQKAFYRYNYDTDESKWDEEVQPEKLHAHVNAYREDIYSNFFECCITLNVMVDPVIASDGFSYERAAIEEWLRQNNRSPHTNEILNKDILIPNYSLRALISSYMERSELIGM